jgi:uncharacterized repeat protein (TIGR01451 family)
MSDNKQVPLSSAPAPSPFEKKTIETPILDTQVRKQIAPPEHVESGGFAGFYKANKYYFFAIIFGIVLISILSLLAFRKPPVTQMKEANVGVSTEAPETVASGGEAVYKITVQNNDSQKLINVELELIYPNGVTFESSSPNPENLSGTLFKVPDLISAQNVAIFVRTKISGNINEQKTLNLKLHYHYSNFNSEFIKDASSTLRLSASNVILELQGPTTTNNAQLVIYTVNYQNNSDADIKNARVKLTYPAGFTFASATPPPDVGTDTWNLTTLAKGSNGNIEIHGNFTSVNPGESKTATADFLILGDSGQYFTQNSSTFATSISSLPLLVSEVLEQNDTGIVKPGDSLTFTIHYQNNAAIAASGVNIEADLNSKAIDLSSIRAEGAQVNNSAIVWNAAGAPQLANLTPNQSGQLSFSLKVSNPATKDSSKSLNIISNIKVVSKEYSSYFPGNQITLKVSSPSSLSKGLNFISGPLPPKVGNITNYQVTLSLSNSTNDYSNGIITASIPANGLVSGSFTPSESKNVQYGSATGMLTWNFGSLPANTGRFSTPKTLDFQVKINPSASQVNTSPVLVKNIKYSAKDLFTGEDITGKISDVTTNDISGTNSYGNGQVQQ